MRVRYGISQTEILNENIQIDSLDYDILFAKNRHVLRNTEMKKSLRGQTIILFAVFRCRTKIFCSCTF